MSAAPYPETQLGKIAKAIHDELYPDEEHPMDECLRAARASLQVASEPSRDMIEAGRKHCRDDQSNYGDVQAKAVFCAMMAEAIKD